MQPELKEPWELVKFRDVEPLECLESGMKPGRCVRGKRVTGSARTEPGGMAPHRK